MKSHAPTTDAHTPFAGPSGWPSANATCANTAIVVRSKPVRRPLSASSAGHGSDALHARYVGTSRHSPTTLANRQMWMHSLMKSSSTSPSKPTQRSTTGSFFS